MMMPMTKGYGRTVTAAVSDDFERASLGSNWSVVFGNGAIVNNSDLGSTGTGQPIVMWVGTALGANQFCEATIALDKVTDMMAQVCVRRQSSDGARYAFYYYAGGDSGEPVNGWRFKFDGVPSANTRTVGALNSTEPAMAGGDRIRLEVRGSGASVSLKGYRNGRLILEADDTAPDRITAVGPPSMAWRLVSGSTTTYPSPVYENWSAGTLL